MTLAEFVLFGQGRNRAIDKERQAAAFFTACVINGTGWSKRKVSAGDLYKSPYASPSREIIGDGRSARELIGKLRESLETETEEIEEEREEYAVDFWADEETGP